MAWCLNYAVAIGGVFFLIFGVRRFMKSRSGWCTCKTCLVGKTVLITGANTGIGYDTALDLAHRGARVILACRNKEKAEVARSKIIDETENENVVVKIIDMASFESVRNFAKEINKTEERLDILINNAGAFEAEDKKTEDGHAFIMQVNYYSHFLLTHLLIELLKKTGPSRVINVSSAAASMAKLDINNIDVFPGAFTVYCNSKLCNVLFTIELAERLRGSEVTTYSLHPGAIKTEIGRNLKGILRILSSLFSFLLKTSERGAQTTIHTAVAKGLEKYNGEHFDDCKKVKRYKTASDLGLPKKLWETTETLIKMEPEEIKI